MKSHKLLIPILLAGGFGACGDDKKADEATKKDCTFGDVGCGTVALSKDDKISISFEKSASGDKYVVMPFSVGNTATVDGAGTEKFSFTTLPVSKASLSDSKINRLFAAQLTEPTEKAKDPKALIKAAGELSRLIYGRWNAKSGRDGQAPGFWNLVRAYDRVHADLLTEGGFNQLFQEPTLEEQFTREIDEKAKASFAPKPSFSLAGVCPAKNGSILLPGGEFVDATEVVDGADYCIVYQDEPKAETDKAAIEATIKATLATYKKVIYKDEFTEAGNGTNFKPVFVIIDPKNPDYAMPAAFLGFLGVFTAQETDASKMPMLYLASDLTHIQGLANDDKGKASFHATIAHELQHAISYYYRAMKPAAADRSLETVFIDEGLAHTMEDIFGYGTEEFADYAGTFLGYFSAGLYPFLGGSKFPAKEYAGENFNVYRGSAQAFLYYLSSQKGGVDFKDGTVSGGDGLKFYADLTSSGKVGVVNLKDTFAHPTMSWVETVGNFLSALILDNTAVPKVAPQHQVKEPFKEVTNLQGTKNRVFGMRFNNFGSIKDPTADGAANPYTGFDAADLEVYHYQTRPGLVTVSDASKPVEIGTPDDVGTAAAVVRIK